MKSILLSLLIFGLSGCAVQSSASFEINVSGTGQFSGSLTVMRDGKVEQRSVEGTAPTSFREQGASVSAVLQKKGTGGTLKAEIVRDGEVVSTQQTTAEYGVVTVSSGM